MKRNYFWKEFKKHFNLRLLLVLLFIVVLFLLPLYPYRNKLFFDSAEYANIIFSSFLTSILLVLVFQFLEFFKNFQQRKNALITIIKSLANLLNQIQNDLSEDKVIISPEIIAHYKEGLIQNLSFSDEINQQLILLYSSEELEYTLQSVKDYYLKAIPTAKKQALGAKLARTVEYVQQIQQAI